MNPLRTPNLQGRFRQNRRGAAGVEFAFIAPVLILFYVGMAELCQGLMAERKLAHAASAIADLVAQNDVTTPAEVAKVLQIAPVVMEPFPQVDPTKPPSEAQRLTLRVSSVWVDPDDEKPKVQWSESVNINRRGDGEEVVLPQVPDGDDGQKTFIAPNESVVMAEVEYSFSTPFSDMFVAFQKLVMNGKPFTSGKYKFEAVYYLRPRRSDQVSCDACGGAGTPSA
jgi:Flp pilus assembly protein TadG